VLLVFPEKIGERLDRERTARQVARDVRLYFPDFNVFEVEEGGFCTVLSELEGSLFNDGLVFGATMKPLGEVGLDELELFDFGDEEVFDGWE
jgi:hypothetical protein